MQKQSTRLSDYAVDASFWGDLDADPDDLDAKQAPQAAVVKTAGNFVAPLPQTVTVARQAQQFDLSAIPVAHQSMVTDASDEHNRARGFVLRTAPLAGGFAVTVGALVVIGGGAWYAVPASFLVFAVVWAIAFYVHLNRSAAGVAWQQSNSMWRIIEREQAHRHQVDWYERQRGGK